MKTKLLLVAMLLCMAMSYAQKTYVPDNNFEQALIDLGYDDVLDDYVLTANINTITNLNLRNTGIDDFKGLQDFESLIDLKLIAYNSKNLNFSNMVALEKLDIHLSYSDLPNLSKNVALKTLTIRGIEQSASVGDLNLKNNLDLEELSVSVSARFLDLSNHTKLKYVSTRNVTGLNLSNCTALDALLINKLGSKGLDLNNCTTLRLLQIGRGTYRNLDLSSCIALKILKLDNNMLVDLNLIKNTILNSISITNCEKLKFINLKNGNNENIQKFIVNNNPDLTCIGVDDATYFTTKWVNIDSHTFFSEECNYTRELTHIPDNNFEQALIDLGYDDVLDDYVPTANINTITSLDVSNKNIADLTGIAGFVELTSLGCKNNALTSLDLSQNPDLSWLNCKNNALTNLNFSQNLKYLFCENNNLTSLDLSQNLEFENLYCSSNALTNLDLSKNPKLDYLFCENNNLTSLNVKNGNNTHIRAFRVTNNPDLSCITVDDIQYSISNWRDRDSQVIFTEDCSNLSTELTYVPDNNFEQALIDLGYDDVLDDYVFTVYINNIVELNISNKDITDLTGVEGFSNLENLNCSNNKLTHLDFSKKTILRSLNCSNNQLTSLDLSKHKNLNNLDCSSNKLTSLNVKNGKYSKYFEFSALNNPDLTCITSDPYAAIYWKNKVDSQTSFSTDCEGIYAGLTYVPDNNFEQKLIDLGYDDVLDDYVLTSEIERITEFDDSGSYYIDFTGLEAFINLRSLSMFLDRFNNKTVDLSKMVYLEKLSIRLDKSGVPDIRKNLALKEIRISTSDVTAILNLKNHLALEKLYVVNSQRGSTNFLDLSNHTKLKEVYINKVTGLNLSNCTALESVKAGNCTEGINLTNCTALKKLDFGSTRIFPYFSSLDVSTCTALESIIIEENRNLKKLDFSKNTKLKELGLYYLLNLESLNLKNGNNTNMTLGKVRIFPVLTCVTVDDVAYATANWKEKFYNVTFSTDCSASTDLTYVPDNNFEQALIDLGYDTVLDDYVPTANINFITNLDISNKSITDLTGIEDFVELITLNCNNNLLTSLDTRHNTELVTFTSDNNKLTYLDICENHKTTYFSANNNAFTGLNVKNGNNTNFTYFSALNNPDLVCITVDNVGYSTTNWTNIDSQSNFNEDCTVSTPDNNFEQALIDLGIDDIVDGKVTLTNAISLLKNLDISNKNIIDLTGIEEFASLEKLNVSDNKIVDLDLSSNLQLLEIITENNNLSSLDVKNGNNSSVTLFNTTRNPNLTCINVDNAAYATANWTTIDVQTSFSDDCRGQVLTTDNFELKGFVMYPNPVQNKLQIHIEEEANYTLVNTKGQIIFKGKLTFGKNLIDVSRLANGVYYLNLKTDSTKVSEKIIKY